MLQHVDRCRDAFMKRAIDERHETLFRDHPMPSSMLHSHEHEMNLQMSPQIPFQMQSKDRPEMLSRKLKMNPTRIPRIGPKYIPKWTPK